MKKILRELGLLAVSWFLALRFALAFHFSALPLVDILPRANLAPQAPQSRPGCPVREPRPASLAIVAGLRAPKLPNRIALTLASGEHRLNSGCVWFAQQ